MIFNRQTGGFCFLEFYANSYPLFFSTKIFLCYIIRVENFKKYLQLKIFFWQFGRLSH